MPDLPVALTIAGSDSSAGAGVQADLKTLESLGVHGLTAVTAVVSETSEKVEAIQTMPKEIVASQIRILFDAFPIRALKTGMLASAEIVETVMAEVPKDVPFVLDPVLVASSGDRLGEHGLVPAMQKLIRSHATLITPNLAETSELVGEDVTDEDSATKAALQLAQDFGCAVLVTGGHLAGDECVDILVEGSTVSRISGPRLMSGDVHGTGCTLSAAITAGLANGLPLADAVWAAKGYMERALRHHQVVGPNMKALAHLGNPVQE